MSKKIDAEGNEIVEFQTLELEEEPKDSPSKLNKMLATLKEKLEPSDYAAVLSDLGLEGEDISNAELLEKFTELLQELQKGGHEEEEEEKEKPDEEKEMMDRKAFIKECMEDGEKDLETCAEEFKKKYPMPEKKEKEEAGIEELGKKEEGDELTELKLRIAKLEDDKKLAGVSAKVEELVKDKHLAPVQRAGVVKLAARLDPEGQEELLEFFRTTQKLNVHMDVGRVESPKPGEEGSNIDAERRAWLLREHGLNGLIDDKADKSKLPWKGNN